MACALACGRSRPHNARRDPALPIGTLPAGARVDCILLIQCHLKLEGNRALVALTVRRFVSPVGYRVSRHRDRDDRAWGVAQPASALGLSSLLSLGDSASSCDT